MSRLIDITGRKYERWTVLCQDGKNKWGQILWKCQCECGTIKRELGRVLKAGLSKSCGCQTIQDTRVSLSTHGHSHAINGNPTKEYHSWTSMRNRCRKSSAKYHLYGARGIKVCERWESFENFLSDMGPRSNGCTLDRIDVNGNYEPNNCRWATSKEQGKNRRYPTKMQKEIDALKTKIALYEAKFGALDAST